MSKKHDSRHHLELVHLTVVEKFLNRKTQRHILGTSLGVCLMLTGSNMALHHWEAVPPVVWDALAYGIHGVGSIPVLKHAEALWEIFSGN